MKKIITAILLSAICMTGYSQDTDTITESKVIESKIVSKSVDEFTDKVTYYSKGIVLYKDGGDMRTQGMIVEAFLKNKNGKLEIGTIYLKVAGMKGCVDKGSTLIVMFENGEKTTLTNWNSFNCKGVNYFSLVGKNDLFKNNKIKAIKYTNKRTYESMVVKNNMNGSYIMDLFLELDKINRGELTVGTQM